MTGKTARDLRDTPGFHIRFAVLSVLAGILTILAVSVNPWLLVMMVGLAVATFAIYDRSDPHWYAL